MAQYEIRRSGRFWKGLSVIRVKAIPSSLPDPEEITREILSICLSDRVSIELDIFSPGKEDEKYRLFLLIRRTSGDRRELENKMTLVPEIILRRMRSAGFIAGLMDSTVFSELELDRFFSKDEKKDLYGTGFYPIEAVLSEIASVPFIPGSYSTLIRKTEVEARMMLGEDSSGGSVFRWKKLLECLVHYPGSLFAVQLIPAVLTRAETEWIKTALGKLLTVSKDLPQEIVERFASLALFHDTKGFLVNMFVAGSESVNQDISYLMHEWSLESYSFLKGSFQNGDYLFFGADLIAGVANVRAHAEQLRGSRYNKMWGRFSRLGSLQTVAAVLQLMEDPRECAALPLAPNRKDLNALPPELINQENGINLGYRVADRQEIYLPLDVLTKHCCVVGKTGSGKTVFFLGLLHQLQNMHPPIPFLVIEPVKTEYRSLKDVIPGLNILTPGNNALSPIELNPFIPPAGVTLGEYRQSLSQIFDISFSMSSLLQSMFPQAVEACYAKYKWRDSCNSASEGIQPFGLHEFIRVFSQYTEGHVDEQSSRNDVKNSGVLRLQKLLSENPVMFDTIRIPDYEKMLTEPTIIELDAIADDEHKMLVLTILLINLLAVIKKRKDSGGKLRNLILIDEAHVVLGADDRQKDTQGAAPAAAGMKLIQEMARTMRSYGTALIFGDQSAAKLTKDVFSAAETKIAFRVNDPEDRKTITSSMLMTEEMSNDIVTVGPGEGFLFTGSMSRPILIQAPDAEKNLKLRKSLPDEEMRRSACSNPLPPYVQCAHCSKCKNSCDRQVRSDARSIAQGVMQNSVSLNRILAAASEKVHSQSKLPAYLDREFAEEAKKAAVSAGITFTERFAACVRIHMIRLLLLDGRCFLTEEQLEGKEPVDGTGGSNPYSSIRQGRGIKDQE